MSEQTFADFKRGRIDGLYAEAYVSLYAFASRCLADSHAMLSEDCVQEAFIKAYQTRHTFATSSQLKAFLYACVRNACISLLRKDSSHSRYLSERHDDYEQELSAAIIEQETLDRLHNAIGQLPDKYRRIFDLSYEQGLCHAEVARLLGITIDGVQKRRARMLSLLRHHFRDDAPVLALVALLA